VGYCSPLGHDTYQVLVQIEARRLTYTRLQDICLRTYYCDGCPTCTTQETCVQSGQCNNRVGCYVPFKATGGCDSGTWTPEGCLNSWNQSRCALEGARWVTEVYQDRATCLAAGSACVETVQLRGYWRTGGVTYKNQTECVECNGQWQSVYQFQEVIRNTIQIRFSSRPHRAVGDHRNSRSTHGPREISQQPTGGRES
jgi:hypothetical protein